MWNNKKTGALEITKVYFDDVVISQTRPSIDEDNDGFTASQGDCNDFDDLTYPGAQEFCGDGVDQNCDGQDLLCDSDVDNDGDGFTEKDGDVNDADSTVYPGALEVCHDNIDNDGDGLTDCLDSACDAVCGGIRQAFGFDTDSEGFVYNDDLFRGTGHPNYAAGGSGSRDLSVTLGGIDTAKILDGMSGGWSRSFEVVDEGPVSISLRFRLTIAGKYESD